MSTHQINPAGVTDIGNVRAVNEDYFLADGDLFAVADGMGGTGGGKTASRIAIDTLRASFSADPTATGLVESVGVANTAVWERSQTDPELEGMGTTVAAVARVARNGEDRLVVVNVGDSRVYLLREHQLSRLSADHSRVADLVRSGEITEEEASKHPERHVLTHALGIGPHVAPHVAHAMPLPGDRLLLCSDGLFNELSRDDIANTLGSLPDAEAAASQLVARAKDNGGNDNITAVVLDVQH